MTYTIDLTHSPVLSEKYLSNLRYTHLENIVSRWVTHAGSRISRELRATLAGAAHTLIVDEETAPMLAAIAGLQSLDVAKRRSEDPRIQQRWQQELRDLRSLAWNLDDAFSHDPQWQSRVVAAENLFRGERP